MSEPAFEEPFTRWLAVSFLKIAFERGEAAVAELSVLFEFEVVGKIVLHDFPQRNGGGFLKERTEVREHLVIVLVLRDVEE